MAIEFDEGEIRSLFQRQIAGERLTRSESALLARWNKAQDERVRRELAKSISKKEYLAMCGRPQTTLERQAKTYGLTALSEPSIDLWKLLPQFHDLLAKHWLKFSAVASEEDLLKGGAGSPALERYRLAKAEREELELSIKRRELVPLAELLPKLKALADMARSRFEAMERAGGPGMRREIDTLVDDWIEQVNRWYPVEGDGVVGFEAGATPAQNEGGARE